MFGYATVVRSKTQGRATFSMEFKEYQACPKPVQEAIIAKTKAESEQRPDCDVVGRVADRVGERRTEREPNERHRRFERGKHDRDP